MGSCHCGEPLQQYWIWRDTDRVPHASSFAPDVPSELELLAVNARDAVRAALAARPKHDVIHPGNRRWDGLCRERKRPIPAAD